MISFDYKEGLIPGFIETIEYNDFRSFSYDMSLYGSLLYLNRDLYVFRGLSSDQYKLIPSCFRKDNGYKDKIDSIINEFLMLEEFYSLCNKNGISITEKESDFFNDEASLEYSLSGRLKWLPSELFELAALAQHYGVPTRLLDWTYDFYIALYFASKSDYSDNKDEYFELWALQKNVAKEMKNTYQNLKFVQPPYYRNPNMTAQKGLFTLWMDDNVKSDDDITALDELMYNKYIENENSVNKEECCSGTPIMYCIRISKSISSQIRSFLCSIGYTTSRLFPGYWGVAKEVVENRFY